MAVAVLGATAVLGEEPSAAWCALAIDEERIELEEATLAVDLAKSDFAAYEEIYSLIAQLWERRAIERMMWVEARYDRDAARLALEWADLILERQEALLEAYRLSCEAPTSDEAADDRARALDGALQRYREMHCASLSKAVEVAKVNLEFSQEFLTSVLNLRAGDVATRPDVIRAELGVERDEKKLAESTRRAEACRAATGRQP
jgi:hypothetical protein